MVNKIALLVMSAGSSSRLGRPKQLVKYKGRTLLGGVLAEMEKIKGVDRFLLLGSERGKIMERIDTAKWNYLENDSWKLGIGKSIAVGVETLNQIYDYIVIVLGDQYRVRASYIQELIAQRTADNIIITYNGESLSPPVIWPKLFFADLLRLQDDTGAKKIIKENKDSIIKVTNLESQYDVDIDADVEKWKEWNSILSENN